MYGFLKGKYCIVHYDSWLKCNVKKWPQFVHGFFLAALTVLKKNNIPVSVLLFSDFSRYLVSLFFWIIKLQYLFVFYHYYTRALNRIRVAEVTHYNTTIVYPRQQYNNSLPITEWHQFRIQSLCPKLISEVLDLFILQCVQYNTITVFKEGSAITFYSFLAYGPQKNR